MRSQVLLRRLAGTVLGLAPLWACAANSSSELLRRDVTGDPGKEALMLTVTYQPGGSSLPHRHDAQVFVYVLEGEMSMQVDGSAPVTLHAGETFYEGRDDIHRVSANASKSAPARILVFMIKDKGKPDTTGVAAGTAK
jgi:quercetin dioxygenase-like cupin family protein